MTIWGNPPKFVPVAQTPVKKVTPEQLPSSKKEALILGAKFYFSISCKHGHNAKRFSHNGACVVCHKKVKKTYNASENGKAINANYYLENKDKILDRQRLARYNLTKAQLEEMLIAQNYVCAICKDVEKIIVRDTLTNLCVDHCHTTGKIRGLLCHDCNTGIGKLKHNLEVLQNAIIYLGKT